MTLAKHLSGLPRRIRGRRVRAATAALLVIALPAITGCVTDGRPVRGEPPPATSNKSGQSATELGLPEQFLLDIPLRRKPVPGWTHNAVDLGMRSGAGIRYSPIGNDENRGIFLANSAREWWVFGVDVADGSRLFEPVWLGPHDDAEAIMASACFLNGPTMAVCLRDDADAQRRNHAWVIDTRTGRLVYDGATGLTWKRDVGDPYVERVGQYLVATVNGVGVYGVGQQAELTWHVPGTGSMTFPLDDELDVAAPVVAVQSRLRGPDVVFSLTDGAVVTPQLAPGESVQRAVAYPGGFAAELRSGSSATVGIAFFDNDGRARSRVVGAAQLRSGSDILPVIQTDTDDRVLTIAGKPLLELSKSVLYPRTRLAGTTLLISTDEERRTWRQFELGTGHEGAVCDREELGYGYIGSGEDVVVTSGSRSPAEGVDLATCETLWALPGSTRTSTTEVWRVHTTLVHRVGDRLSALVAPG